MCCTVNAVNDDSEKAMMLELSIEFIIIIIICLWIWSKMTYGKHAMRSELVDITTRW